ncbi:uncharacterized protein [Elaeis guineensis]|uniref:uncharacterized protein isoform X6 n=1 Tax=Elaeis guineensis var. tenera TaxID=51953 RepID=UPI003C6D8ED5
MLLQGGKLHLKLFEKEEEELEMFQVAGRGPAVQRHEESSGSMTRCRRIGRGRGRRREVSDDDTTTTELEFEFKFFLQLSRKVINLEALQQIACCGHLNGELRATVWKLLLGYLPAEIDAWEGELASNRLRYAELKEELLVNPSEYLRKEDETLSASKNSRIMGVDGQLSRQEIFNGDHPLSLGNDSIWHQYFKDGEIVEQIDRDLERTHPDIKFFSGDISHSKRNQKAMRNILLLFAKLNPAIGYVQGMNEVLAPLYYVFSTDPNEQNAVNPQFYAFRWITLLLTQEFEFHCIMRIWDCLLSNPLGVQEMLLRVCCAMLVCVRRELLKGDFTSNLKLLQHYPETDLDYLLEIAHHLTPVS